MTIRRMDVLDADGKRLNTILVDESAAKDYYPGYGAALVDVGEEPVEPPPNQPAKPEWLGLLPVHLVASLADDEYLDLKTGEVVKVPKPDVPPDVDPVPVVIGP